MNGKKMNKSTNENGERERESEKLKTGGVGKKMLKWFFFHVNESL